MPTFLGMRTINHFRLLLGFGTAMSMASASSDLTTATELDPERSSAQVTVLTSARAAAAWQKS
jgi:hypothetical protein